MTTASMIVSRSEPRAIVCWPVPMAKMIMSAPGLALALMIACRSESGPESLTLRTWKVDGVTRHSRGTKVSRETRRRGAGRNDERRLVRRFLENNIAEAPAGDRWGTRPCERVARWIKLRQRTAKHKHFLRK